MPLKFKYDSKDQVPAEQMPFYAERDGAWILDVDGVVEKAKGHCITPGTPLQSRRCEALPSLPVATPFPRPDYS